MIGVENLPDKRRFTLARVLVGDEPEDPDVEPSNDLKVQWMTSASEFEHPYTLVRGKLGTQIIPRGSIMGRAGALSKQRKIRAGDKGRIETLLQEWDEWSHAGSGGSGGASSSSSSSSAMQ